MITYRRDEGPRVLRITSREKIYEYEVEGIGSFPYDMLRYDSAWPAREEDSARIEQRSFHGHGVGDDTPANRRIRINGFSFPTDARWRSFGWKVVA